MNRSTPPSLATRNETYCEMCNEVPMKNSVLSREIKYLELQFNDLNCSGYRYGDAWDLCWVNLSPIVLSSESKVTTGCGDELEVVIIAHDKCLMYKTIPRSRNSDDFLLLVCRIV